jgi:hypothetical protein
VKLVQGITYSLEISVSNKHCAACWWWSQCCTRRNAEQALPSRRNDAAAITYTDEKHGTVPSV